MSSFFNSSIKTAIGYKESSDALSLAAIVLLRIRFLYCWKIFFAVAHTKTRFRLRQIKMSLALDKKNTVFYKFYFAFVRLCSRREMNEILSQRFAQKNNFIFCFSFFFFLFTRFHFALSKFLRFTHIDFSQRIFLSLASFAQIAFDFVNADFVIQVSTKNNKLIDDESDF